MNGLDLVSSAIGNTFRSKTRTTLTVIAIFIGAFTLAITSGMGTGINQYINSTVSAIGADNVVTVTKTPDQPRGSGPVEYDPNQSTVTSAAQGPRGGGTVDAITTTDLDGLRAVKGVESVDPNLSVRPDYIQFDGGKQYQLSIGSLIVGTKLQLAAGTEPDRSSSDFQLAIPESFVKPLGFSSDKDAVGKTIVLGITDAQGTASTVEATVTGVTEAGLIGGGGATANEALTKSLFETQTTGLSETARTSYAAATVRFDESATDITALKKAFTDLGYDSVTLADQIGTFKTVIDGIVLVLNAFAVIALLAAGFGIVNTLLMSVQERTREIGLMKAMGMGGGRVFGLFSLEAVFIGFLGSAIGAVVAILVGGAISGALSRGLLANLPGLHLIAFDPVSIITIILVVMAIAFLAGTIPALRAARQDPIESLRYE
jgi:putative ABC transport system permease protein